MFITRNDNKKVDFATIKKGDVFKDECSIFMSIEDVENKNGGSYNAVDVETGELTHFYADEKVFALKAELVVS